MGILGNFFRPSTQTDEDASASARILAQLKEKRGEETGKWLALMKDSSQLPVLGPPPTIEDVDRRETLNEEPYSPPIETQYTASDELDPSGSQTASTFSSQSAELVEWVNRLFTEFTRQADQFNTTATDPKLILTMRLPEFAFELPHYGESYDPDKKISVFKGHVVTAHWAMLVQGYGESIDVYMIPAEEVLNFTLNDVRESQLNPFMSISSALDGGHRLWKLGGTAITPEMVPLITKELLGDLVRIASGAMSESELFAHHEIGLVLGETVAKGYGSAAKNSESEVSLVRGGLGDETSTVSRSTQSAANLPSVIESLTTWTASEVLIKALDQDLSVLAALQNDSLLDHQATAEKLSDLSTRLRTLVGELSGLLADYRPRSGSKYNPS
jgi:hypothetical protein